MGGISGIPWPSKAEWCDRNLHPDLFEEGMMCISLLDSEYVRWQNNETKKKQDKTRSSSKRRR